MSSLLDAKAVTLRFLLITLITYYFPIAGLILLSFSLMIRRKQG